MTRIHILKPGTYRDMNGADVRFTASDLAQIAQSYDPKLSQAPIVIGHPAVEDPAYGWAESLSTDADGLHAETENVDPAFADLVRAGRYRTVSGSFYRPDSPGNPKPGSWYLRHIGFLGAQPPAVKGLKRAQLAGATEGVTTVEFGEDGDADLWNRFKRWLKTNLTADLADGSANSSGLSDEAWNGDSSQWKDAASYCEACLVDLNDGSGPKVKWKCHLPVKEPDGDGLNRHALFAAQGALIGARGGVDLPTDTKRSAAKRLAAMMRSHGLAPASALDHMANFSEDKEADVADVKELEQREAKLAEGEKALKAREDKIAADEATRRKADVVAFADELAKAGKVLPVDKPIVVELLMGLKPDGKIELGEGDGKKEVVIGNAVRDFFNRLPKAVELGEVAQHDKSAAKVIAARSKDRDTTDPVALAAEIAADATALVKAEADKGNAISHAEAVRRIQQAKEAA